MTNRPFDITILTDSRYVNPINPGWYEKNILLEDGMLQEAFEKLGLSTTRTNWDNPEIDWSLTKSIIFRTTWDYFHRFDQFLNWLSLVNTKTHLINPYEMILWNIDKSYLKDLSEAGLQIPPTIFIQKNEQRSLNELCQLTQWNEFVLKPNVGGGGRLTYRFKMKNIEEINAIFENHVQKEAFLLQEFQHNIVSKGEIALMVFGGRFSHAILKIAKAGDFRVQDDFGGTVHPYSPTKEEISFAEKAVSLCNPLPAYARVDLIWDNDGNPCLSELELIEPELWFRNKRESADMLAEVIYQDLINR